MVYDAVGHGASVHEHSKALDIAQTSAGTIVTTEGDTITITARKAAVLAVHNTTFQFLSGVTTTTLPLHTYVGVTPPLAVDINTLLPSGYTDDFAMLTRIEHMEIPLVKAAIGMASTVNPGRLVSF